MVTGGHGDGGILRVTTNMTKVLVIGGTKDTQILISSKLVSFFYALYFYSALGNKTTQNFILLRLVNQNMTEKVEMHSFHQCCPAGCVFCFNNAHILQGCVFILFATLCHG